MRKVAISIPLNTSGANLVSECDYVYDAPHRPDLTITGTATRSAMYDYGRETTETTQGADAVGGLLAACFSGTAGETGLYYYGARFYNPELSRWASRDPIGELGFNLSADNLRKTMPDKGGLLQETASGSLGVSEQCIYIFLLNAPPNRFDPVGLRDTDCTSVCAMAKRLGLFMDGWGGTVICYKGKLCPCVNWPSGTDPGFIECAKVHEETHIKHDTFVCSPCAWYSVAMSPGKDPAGDECHAYTANLACLIGQKLKRCRPGDYVCEILYDLEITRIRKIADKVCSYAHRE